MAGVSIATASRALSNPDLVADDTRNTVQVAAESCGYQINLVARSLRKQRTNSILVLIPEIDNRFYPAIIEGLEERAFALGFSMILGLTGNYKQRENSYFDIIKSRRADGLVILDGGLDRLIEGGLQFNVPTVQVLECLGGTTIPTVRIDDRHIAALAVKHLVDLGHRRIGHITGSGNSLVSIERLGGYREAIAAHGCSADADLTACGNYTHDGGEAAMHGLLDRDRPPTAVFCANDASALGAIHACRKRGLKVPDDLSIIGIDDIDDAAACDPPLTTFHQPRREIGANAMDMLIALMDKAGPGNRNVIVPVQLVLRQSTAPLIAISHSAGTPARRAALHPNPNPSSG